MKTAATEDKQAVESTACLKVGRQIGFKSGTIFHEKQGQATVMQRPVADAVWLWSCLATRPGSKAGQARPEGWPNQDGFIVGPPN